MIRKNILPLLLSGLLLAACGNSEAVYEKTDTASAPSVSALPGNAPEQVLVTSQPKPAGVNFARENFEGLGTLELPAGGDWKRNGNEITNDRWNATILIQSQPQGMAGMEKDFLDSYNDMNVQDAPGWNRGAENMGTIGGLKVARTEGTFNNGTAMHTRDYVFFGPAKTAIVQMRIAEEHLAQLAPMADYIAGSFQPM